MFERGYLSKKSGHSRGSTVDLTIIATGAAAPLKLGPFLSNGELDMGSPFDFFDERSHTDHPTLPDNIRHNRNWLVALMARHGFVKLPTEW